ncbi:Pao retrotransposon peptidase [Popillia japonica]|uniref:Pao retrotransposon peptidase n=1 Tax=Popillia japonica TaxID=7064 RepID=A0AAW1ID84_POPJA
MREYADIADDESVKTLGLYWDPKADSLNYFVNLEIQQKVTKLVVLSTMSKIFDPLRLICPIVVKVKLLLQQICQSRVGWDESLPMDLDTCWRTFQKQLIEINDIRIPRRVTTPNFSRIELYGFYDAPERAYGACVYVRTTDVNGIHFSKLISAKLRVSPLKVVALPRLELCGALLLVRLMTKIAENVKLKCMNRYYWCDSTIVLHWIAAEPITWKTFVTNRVAEIRESTTVEWKYVNSELNPVDIVSRGASPRQLFKSELWWYGPEFLLKNSEH